MFSQLIDTIDKLAGYRYAVDLEMVSTRQYCVNQIVKHCRFNFAKLKVIIGRTLFLEQDPTDTHIKEHIKLLCEFMP